MIPLILGKLILGLVGAVQPPVGEPWPEPSPDPGTVVPAPPPAESPPVEPLRGEPPSVEPPPTPAVASAPREPAATPPDRPALLRPTGRNHFFTLLVGGSRFLRGGNPEIANLDFKVEAAFGAHGKVRKNLGGALVAQLRSSYPFNGFTIGPRLQWDVPIVPEYAIYFNANITLGYRVLFTQKGDGTGTNPYEATVLHAGVGALGFGVSTIVAEQRWARATTPGHGRG